MKRNVLEAYEPAAATAKKRRRPSILPLVVFAAQQRIVRGFERAIVQAGPHDPARLPDGPGTAASTAPTRGVRITDIA